MLLLIAVFVGRASDPLAIVAGLVIGLASRSWWHVVIAAAVVGVVLAGPVRMYFHILGETPFLFAIDCLVIEMWAAIAFQLKRAARRPKPNQN
ncbi:MAG: hypothetical protein ABSC92_08210 [Rhizomicrobium sp.]